MLYMSTNYTGGLINSRGHQNDDPYYLVASFNLIFSVEVNHHKVCKRLLFSEPF